MNLKGVDDQASNFCAKISMYHSDPNVQSRLKSPDLGCEAFKLYIKPRAGPKCILKGVFHALVNSS